MLLLPVQHIRTRPVIACSAETPARHKLHPILYRRMKLRFVIVLLHLRVAEFYGKRASPTCAIHAWSSCKGEAPEDRD